MSHNIPPPTLEQSCMEALHWRWIVPDEIPLPTLRQQLRQRGFRDNSKFEWVWELEQHDENKIIIVPKTRRLQIRIHYTIPKPKRPTSAWSIALVLHEICLAITNTVEKAT